jgi:esterase/lipase
MSVKLRFKDQVEKDLADLKDQVGNGFKDIKKSLSLITKKIDTNMADFKKLESEVAENTTVIQSAIALIKGIAQQISDAKGDQAKIDALSDKLNSDADALAAAVAANTPTVDQPEAPASDVPA